MIHINTTHGQVTVFRLPGQEHLISANHIVFEGDTRQIASIFSHASSLTEVFDSFSGETLTGEERLSVLWAADTLLSLPLNDGYETYDDDLYRKNAKPFVFTAPRAVQFTGENEEELLAFVKYYLPESEQEAFNRVRDSIFPGDWLVFTGSKS